MGLFGSLLSPFKAIGKVVGNVASKAAPLAAFIPGVGPLAAAGLGAGGKLLGDVLAGNKINVGSVIGSGALAGVGSALGGGKLISKLGGIGKAAPLAGVTGGGGKGLLSGALDFVKKNPGLVLGGVQALNAAGQQKNANAARERAVGAFRPAPFSFGNTGNPYAAQGGMIPARAAALRSLQSVTGS